MKQENKPQQMDTIANIASRWNNMASVYQNFDESMLTFYYTLIHMLDLNKAKHILEIACGTGKLIPEAIALKPKESTYLATDLCEKMVALFKENVGKYLSKMGVSLPTEEWMSSQNLEVRAANGEEPIECNYKFDRIIANLVLMLTEDPVKMMRNLHGMAEEGCLLGVTIWGDKAQSNLLTILKEALQANGLPVPHSRSNFHLFNRLGDLAAETGWEVVVQWQQNAPFHYIQIEEGIMAFVNFWCKGQQTLIDYHTKRINEIFGEKKVLNFPVQMALLRKK